MKKLLPLLLFLFFADLASAQLYANGVLIDNTNAEHYLTTVPKYKKKQITFNISTYKTGGQLTDAKGEPLVFDSLLLALEFFYREGWEFCTTFEDTFGVSGTVSTNSTYLLQRRK